MNDVSHDNPDGAHRDELAPGTAPRLKARQSLTVILLFGGYAACYFCRADLSVAAPLLIDELGSHGVSHADALVYIGQITSLGVFAYAIGKLFLTGTGRFLGRPPEFPDQPRRRYRFYRAVHPRRRTAGVYDRLARQPPDAVDRLGGAH